MTKAELRHLVWRHYGIRADHRASKEHLQALILLTRQATPSNRVNDMRDDLIRYVERNKNRLSLFCNGDCYHHTDAVVLYCYFQLEEARRGEAQSAKGHQDNEEAAR